MLSTPCRWHTKSQPVPRCAHGLLLRWGGLHLCPTKVLLLRWGALHWCPTKCWIQRPTSPSRPGRAICRCRLRWERGRIHRLGIGCNGRSGNWWYGPRWWTLCCERVGLWVACIVLRDARRESRGARGERRRWDEAGCHTGWAQVGRDVAGIHVNGGRGWVDGIRAWVGVLVPRRTDGFVWVQLGYYGG